MIPISGLSKLAKHPEHIVKISEAIDDLRIASLNLAKLKADAENLLLSRKTPPVSIDQARTYAGALSSFDIKSRADFSQSRQLSEAISPLVFRGIVDALRENDQTFKLAISEDDRNTVKLISKAFITGEPLSGIFKPENSDHRYFMHIAQYGDTPTVDIFESSPLGHKNAQEIARRLRADHPALNMFSWLTAIKGALPSNTKVTIHVLSTNYASRGCEVHSIGFSQVAHANPEMMRRISEKTASRQFGHMEDWESDETCALLNGLFREADPNIRFSNSKYELAEQEHLPFHAFSENANVGKKLKAAYPSVDLDAPTTVAGRNLPSFNLISKVFGKKINTFKRTGIFDHSLPVSTFTGSYRVDLGKNALAHWEKRLEDEQSMT